MIKPLDALDKIGNFIEKYTGSEYNYSEPTGEIGENYSQIGEILGIPIWIDDNKRYENEFLDFPSFSDILSTIANVGVSFNIKNSECSICLVVSFAIPLIEYPPITICLEKPDCKKKKEEEEKDCTPLEELPKPPTGEDWNYDDLDKKPFPPRCPDENNPKENDDNFFGEDGVSYRVEYWKYGRSLDWGVIVTNTFYEGEVTETYNYPKETEPYLYKYTYMTAPIKVIEFKNNSYKSSCSNGGSGYSSSWTNSYTLVGQQGGLGLYVVEGARSDSCTLDVMDTRSFKRSDTGWGYGFADIKFFEMDGTEVPRKKKTLPPPPIPDPVMPKDCCDELKKILARIEKKVTELHKVVNPPQFFKKEVQMPANWIYPGNEKKPVIFDDLPDAILAVARLVDRRLGYLPQLVRIKDADPTKPGDQEMNLVINSLADANRLILEYLLQAHGDIGGIQMLGQANLFESGITHQIAVTIREELDAISAYLGFADGKRKEKFKMAFNPKVQIDPQNPKGLDKILPEFLRHTTQEVEVNDFTGKKTLSSNLADIKRDTSNAAAAVTRKLSEHSLDDLIEETQNIERLKRLLLVREIIERNGVSDLKEFLDDAELAYPSSEQSPTEKAKPYGFQPTDKPKMSIKTRKSRKNKYKK